MSNKNRFVRPRALKIWITKYALTTGVVLCRGDVDERNSNMVIVEWEGGLNGENIFYGGKVKEYESEWQAARRELLEETGIEHIMFPTMKEIFRRDGGVTFQMFVSQIVRTGAPGDGETGRVAWVTPEQLMEGPFSAYNRNLLMHIGRVS